MKSPVVYLLASAPRGTLYVGVTSDLLKRVWQHREGLADGFTKQHGVKTLVWYEQHATMASAIGREKAIKKWLRQWKLRLIEESNPGWRDLWSSIAGAGLELSSGHDNMDSRLRGNDERGGGNDDSSEA